MSKLYNHTETTMHTEPPLLWNLQTRDIPSRNSQTSLMTYYYLRVSCYVGTYYIATSHHSNSEVSLHFLDFSIYGASYVVVAFRGCHHPCRGRR